MTKLIVMFTDGRLLTVMQSLNLKPRGLFSMISVSGMYIDGSMRQETSRGGYRLSVDAEEIVNFGRLNIACSNYSLVIA